MIYEIFAPGLASLFIKNEVTVKYAAAFLRRMVLAMPLMSLCYPLIIKFQAMGKAKESITVSILRKGVLDIPLYFMMDALFPLYGCMWVQPIVDTLSLGVAAVLNRRIVRHDESTRLEAGEKCGMMQLHQNELSTVIYIQARRKYCFRLRENKLPSAGQKGEFMSKCIILTGGRLRRSCDA